MQPAAKSILETARSTWVVEVLQQLTSVNYVEFLQYEKRLGVVHPLSAAPVTVCS
jgi:hypothetical protein